MEIAGVKYLNIAETARRVGVAVRTLREWLQRGIFEKPAIKTRTRRSYWTESQLIVWAAQNSPSSNLN